MVFSGKKYLTLAVAGAVILGVGTYILLSNYFERVNIAVAANDIKKNSKIEEKDIKMLPYYKQALPKGYVSKKSEIIGMIIKTERKLGDPLTSALFIVEDPENCMLGTLEKDEVLMAININYQEPLIDYLQIGNSISIVSTEKERDISNFISNIKTDSGVYENTSKSNGNIVEVDSNETVKNGAIYEKTGTNKDQLQDESATAKPDFTEKSIIDLNSFYLDENIIVIDSQFIIKNLKIIDIKKTDIESNGLITSKNKSSWCIFIKCSIREAPVISRITKEDKYKIFLEKVSAE